MAFGGQINDLRNRLFGRDTLSKRVIAQATGIFIVFAIWVVMALLFPFRLMPFPWETLALVWDILSSGEAWDPLVASTIRVFGAFVLAMVAGSTIGILAGTSDYGRRFFVPYMVGGFTVPGIAWAAIFTLMLGIGYAAPVMAAAFTTYPYVAVNVWEAVQDIDADLLEVGEAYNLKNTQLIKSVVIPSIAPSLFNAVRYGFAICWKVVTTAEIFASSRGIGAELIRHFQQFQFVRVWAWAALFMLIMILVEYVIMRPLQRKVYEYRPDTDLSLLD